MLPEIIDIKGDSNVVSVIGADTVFGIYLTQLLYKKGKTVFAFTEKKKFTFSSSPMAVYGKENAAVLPVPVISDSIVICINPVNVSGVFTGYH